MQSPGWEIIRSEYFAFKVVFVFCWCCAWWGSVARLCTICVWGWSTISTSLALDESEKLMQQEAYLFAGPVFILTNLMTLRCAHELLVVQSSQ